MECAPAKYCFKIFGIEFIYKSKSELCKFRSFYCIAFQLYGFRTSFSKDFFQEYSENNEFLSKIYFYEN